MATIEQKIGKKSVKNVEKLRLSNKKIAGTIFDNMVRLATSKRYALSITENRVTSVKVPVYDLEFNSESRKFGTNFKAVVKKIWFTPYIYNNELYLKNDDGYIPGKLIFGKSVNRVI
jgi:hypothetical protein